MTRERVKYEEMKRLYFKCRSFSVIEHSMELRLYLGANLWIVTLICFKITKGYGLSEVGGCCIFTLDKYNEVGSLGVRHPLNDIILRNPKTKEIYPARYVGEGEALINSETV